MIGKLRLLRENLGPLLALAPWLRDADLPARGHYKHPKVLTGTLLAQLNNGRADVASLADVEFQVFSQFGDDGIIQYLTHALDTPKTFVEFGVEDYIESSTRFLLFKDKWTGLVLDGDAGHVKAIRADHAAWLFNLRAEQAFVTAENINDLLTTHGFAGPLGLFSIDVDGVDYWIWKATTACDPDIVVVEYNSIFGPERAVTVPYDPAFSRFSAHPSRLYWGASLGAFKALAAQKGYVFVGCNANGNNAYFVKDLHRANPAIARLKPVFVDASFSEYAVDGRLLRGAERLNPIAGMPVVNVLTGETERL